MQSAGDALFLAPKQTWPVQCATLRRQLNNEVKSRLNGARHTADTGVDGMSILGCKKR